jgi:hypothetical protein
MRRFLLIAGLAVSVAFGESGFGVLVNQDGSFGLALNAKQAVKTVRLGQGGKKKKSKRIEFGYGLDAVFGSKLESLPNHLYANLDATLKLPTWPGDDSYFNAALTGASIEAAQDFRRADFAAAARVSLTNEYLGDFMLGLFGDTSFNGIAPFRLALGYTQLARVCGPDSLGPGWGSRLDGDLFCSIPFTEKLSLGGRVRAFNQPADAFNFKTWKLFGEFVATFKLNETWMNLKYERGGLPPLYEPVSNWSVGVGFAFD